MKFTFKLRFHTRFGQSLYLVGDHEIFGNYDLEEAIPLQYESDSFWQVTFILPRSAAPDKPIQYQYFLRESDGSIVWDWGSDRKINPASFAENEVLIMDSWNSGAFIANAFCTEPFQEVLLPKAAEFAPAPGNPAVTHWFRAKAPLLNETETLCLLGSTPALGSWDVAEPVLMRRSAGELDFSAGVDLSGAPPPVKYKYGVYDLAVGRFVRYEDGPDRVLGEPPNPRRKTIVNDGFAVLPETTWKGAGVAIPVFSLRSEASFGVGEFGDLKLLADWAKKTGLKLIQVLPVNDTTARHNWADSYPYAAISTFALHPQYLRLSEVAGPREKKILAGYEEERQRLNALPAVDYEAMMKAKLAALREIYRAAKERVFRSKPYKHFLEQNADWLIPYAAFCYFRDKFGTPDFSKWPGYEMYDAARVRELMNSDAAMSDATDFHCFTQFHLDLQLRDAAKYAHENGVILKGDIAIGVYRHGADVWQAPGLYHTNLQAGAPPDPFADKGQNWGFPTYNWEAMKADGYRWWRRRFEQMSRYFDAFRVDHILGFFRIWSIPQHAVEGILGYFDPALPLQAGEFADNGMVLDRNRLVQPFIPPEDAEELLEFVERDRFGNISLKEPFRTQQQVNEFFNGQPDTDERRALKQRLFDVLSNVILVEAEHGEMPEFHFRFGMEGTSSFRALDSQSQAVLKSLYVDYFFRRQEAFWMAQGLEKLPALKRATNLLICGEDLGMVPACVPVVMRWLGLLGLEVQRMPKELGHAFSRPAEAPYLSVVTPSTHDMSTIRGWWREDKALIQRFYNAELGMAGDPPMECEGWINRAVVAQHLASPAMWSVFLLQDLLGVDEGLRHPDAESERINVPANPTYYWRYRMHLNLEELLRQDQFNRGLAQMVRENGR